MRCLNCGHQNPDENRFCGMCGNLLVGKSAVEAEYAVKPASVLTPERPAAEPVPVTEIKPRAVESPRPQAREPESVELRHDPVEVHDREPVAPAPRSDRWWVDESETTVGGPSFLGLSGESSSGGYSYLFQEEEERSHKAGWVLLAVLLVLGGVVYAKWQPIRDYVLTTAVSHSRPKQPVAQENSNSQPEQAATNAPTTTLASSDTQSAPAITSESTPSKATDQKASDRKEGLPEGDKESAADNSKAGDKTPAKSEKQQTAGKGETPPVEEETPAADEEKPAPAKRGRGAPANEGSELVNSGERYLYGRGVARNCDQAVSYFNAAAAKQNPQAFSHLGALYATGECVPMDRALAYAWFRRAYAKEPSNHYFEQNLTMLWREMTPDEKHRATGNKVSNF